MGDDFVDHTDVSYEVEMKYFIVCKPFQFIDCLGSCSSLRGWWRQEDIVDWTSKVVDKKYFSENNL